MTCIFLGTVCAIVQVYKKFDYVTCVQESDAKIGIFIANVMIWVTAYATMELFEDWNHYIHVINRLNKLVHSYKGFCSHYRMPGRSILNLFLFKLTVVTVIGHAIIYGNITCVAVIKKIWLNISVFLTHSRGNLWLCAAYIWRTLVLMRCGSGNVLRIGICLLTLFGIWHWTRECVGIDSTDKCLKSLYERILC